jgi:hypothetical protein
MYMDYYQKYIKYKEKYLNFKKSFEYQQKGGDMPDVNILKNINLFNSDMEKLLNPLHGFVLINTNVIENYYKFYIPNDHFFKTLMISIYNEVGNLIRPTNSLMNNKEVSIKDFGILLGYLYCVKTFDIIKMINIKINEFRYTNDKLKEKRRQIKIKDDTEEIKNKLRKKKENLTYSIKNNEDKIKNFLKFDSIINEQLRDLLKKMTKIEIKDVYFHVLLSVVWWKANDKNGIKEYYEGVNCILGYLNNILDLKIELINIPADFENDIYTKEEMNNYEANNYNQALTVSYKIGKGSLKIFYYENGQYERNNFPDCGETTLRNFFNILLFNNGNFNVDILDKLNASEELKEYYRVFNNINLQVSRNKVNIYGQKLNARDAWIFIVSELENVSYVKTNYEINAGLNKDNTKINMLEVIGHLIKDVNTWNDLKKKIKEINTSNELTIRLNERGNGQITILNQNGEYKLLFMDSHYDIVKSNSSRTTLFTNLTDEEIKTTKILQNIIPHKKVYFLNIKYTRDLLFRFLLDEIVVPNEYYYLALLYLKSKYPMDTSFINLNISDPSSYNLSSIGITYDESGFYNYENITEIKNSRTLDYFKLINLKKLIYERDSTEFFNLPNSLTHLSLLSGFNRSINNKLPSSLTHLTLGISTSSQIININLYNNV